MKNHHLHLVVALLILAAALGGYGISYAAISAKSVAVADLQEQIDAKAMIANRVSSARTTLAATAVDEAAILGYFVPENGIAAFIDGLEARGKAQGTSVDVLSVSANAGKAQHAFLLELTVTGPFDAVMRTVGSIEYAPYDISVTQLSLSRQSSGDWQADMNLSAGSIAATSSVSSGASASTTP